MARSSLGFVTTHIQPIRPQGMSMWCRWTKTTNVAIDRISRLPSCPNFDPQLVFNFFDTKPSSKPTNFAAITTTLLTMDPTLAKIFLSNSQWLADVNATEPEFFEQSAKSQSPKVAGVFLPPRCTHVQVYACRSSGLDAQTRASPRASSPLRDQAISSSTVISPSVSLFYPFRFISRRY